MSDTISRARAFAHDRHAGQTRKGAEVTPYITHPGEVATLVTAWGGDNVAIAAAWLHDTVEDCPGTTPDELEARFGSEIAAVVAELTDDKSLPKAERKRLQVLHAPVKSPRAALVKIADKTSNVGAIGTMPPADWDQARKLAYLDWAAQVVAGLRHRPAVALAAFERAVTRTRETLG